MRFSTFLLLFLFSFSFCPSATAQNLIYDWSVEEYETCPTGLALTMFVPHWLSFRANPDYFNSCSPTLGPLTNYFGWQHPKTGDGLIGVVTFSTGLSNAREYPGVELLEPLVVGESYDISYYVAAAFNPNFSGRATNNLGILLMTENYLVLDEQGITPNFAHLNIDTIVSDTASWVHVTGTIVADSAYQYVAFGNFYDDASTQVVSLDPEDPDPSNLAYYYFDDFCVVPEGGNCYSLLSMSESRINVRAELFPNPAYGAVHVRADRPIRSVRFYTLEGKTAGSQDNLYIQAGEVRQIDVSRFRAGIYLIEIETEEGIARKKLVINP